MSVLENIAEIRSAGLASIEGAQGSDELEAVRVSLLGKKGSLTAILRTMREVPADQKAAVGKEANLARKAIEEALEARKAVLASAELEAKMSAEAIDITLPGRSHPIGTRHLIANVTDQICDIFIGLGYRVISGPEVETQYYNFEALNTPADHPSRGLQDSFYVVDASGAETNVRGESNVLLRTQTSGTQIHAMEAQRPPIYVVSPGKVYRKDVPDPSHLPQFTQVEGLVVDEGITFGDLKGTLDYFCKQMFGEERETRFRPHFFPFTEPSAEVDVSCGICHGEGCRFCKGTGWVEVLGCGMVDPNVFGFVDIDPEKYSGFAFGMGAERIACLKYNVPDLRMLLEGDMRFLRQF
ncbi:MAG: phenylalanine--tRNA ligase subunit alpha [Coriobacteriales bacterium]|jgi:phenylalanyl-tRNA synthetase alpha chain